MTGERRGGTHEARAPGFGRGSATRDKVEDTVRREVSAAQYPGLHSPELRGAVRPSSSAECWWPVAEEEPLAGRGPGGRSLGLKRQFRAMSRFRCRRTTEHPSSVPLNRVLRNVTA